MLSTHWEVCIVPEMGSPETRPWAGSGCPVLRPRETHTPSICWITRTRNWSIAAQSVTRLLYHMSRIFEDSCKTDAMHRGLQIDRKRRQQLRERRLALGHKPDDHEDEEFRTAVSA